jgi:hypothetical protein
LFRRVERDRVVSVPDLERTEDPELHAPFYRLRDRFSTPAVRFGFYRDSTVARPNAPRLALVSDVSERSPREGWSYSGEVWTDEGGLAVVVLPRFVGAHRAGFEYELRPVDSRCSATLAKEIADASFTISTDEPHVKVAWRVTPLRATPPERGGT